MWITPVIEEVEAEANAYENVISNAVACDHIGCC